MLASMLDSSRRERISHGFKTSWESPHTEDMHFAEGNNLWNVQVLCIKRYRAEFVAGDDHILINSPTVNYVGPPFRFYIHPYTFGDTNSLQATMQELLLEQLTMRHVSYQEVRFELDINSIIVELAEAFKMHMMMCDDEKRLTTAFITKLVLCVDFKDRLISKFEDAGMLSCEKFRACCEDGCLSACAVCLDEFADGTGVVRTICSHLFHYRCLTTWLLKNEKNGCPMCRVPLR